MRIGEEPSIDPVGAEITSSPFRSNPTQSVRASAGRARREEIIGDGPRELLILARQAGSDALPTNGRVHPSRLRTLDQNNRSSDLLTEVGMQRERAVIVQLLVTSPAHGIAHSLDLDLSSKLQAFPIGDVRKHELCLPNLAR
jgi:hypothetical protein